MKKAILKYQWKYAFLTRNFWLPLGIFFFLWFFISPILLKKLDSSSLYVERLEEEKSSQTTVVDTADFPTEIYFRERKNSTSLTSETTSQSRLRKEKASYWVNDEKIEVFLFVAVASAPECEKRRSTIRATWAQYFQNAQVPIETQNLKDGNVRQNVTSLIHDIKKRPIWHMLFFIGRSSSPKVQERVEEEAKVFGDVILLPYQEGYYNLTLKTLAMFQWASQHVNSSFVFKADDDVYLHIPRLIEWLEECPKAEFYSGHGSYDKKPIREPITHKWYISEEEYPYSFFPDYCNGNGYVMSMDLVHRVASCFPRDWSCSWITEKMQDVQDASFRKEAYKRCRQSLANDCGYVVDMNLGSLMSPRQCVNGADL
ncbi:Lactosylceramide 1,3-N-acetyl-beta-D-glucosaminyltransferase [Galdieria sulphuraria]|nr:Lactosylceramide 1,3-N-acetyl-beta-D-glucosaminyltransferase [Galdieria sulphuraria]